MTIAPDLAACLLEQLARFEIEAFDRARAVGDPRSPEAAAFELRREEALQDTLRRALLLGDREIAHAPLRHVAAPADEGRLSFSGAPLSAAPLLQRTQTVLTWAGRVDGDPALPQRPRHAGTSFRVFSLTAAWTRPSWSSSA